jgi:transcriptional regulator of arginine metabolism
MVGTIAGDDTILVIMRSEQQTRNLYSLLQKKLS